MKIPPLRSNPDGRWFVEIPGTNRTRKYFGRDRTAAEADYRGWLGKWIEGKVVVTPKRPLCLADAVKKYTEDVASAMNRSDRNYVRRMMERLCSLCGQDPIASFGAKPLQAIVTDLAKEGFSQCVCSKFLLIMRRFARWLVVEELAPAEVFIKVSAFRPLPETI